MKTSCYRKTRCPSGWYVLGFALLLTTVPGRALGQTARAQFVHASPDPAVSMVDVYFDDVLQFDDFDKLTATSFIDVPAGPEILVTIAEPSSSSPLDSVRTFSVQFDEGASYYVVVVGVLDPSMFPPNPDGLDTAFGLRLVDGARETMLQPQDGVYDARLFNAVPDAPSVDFVGEIPNFPPETIFSDIAYGSSSGYGGAVTNANATGTFLGDLGAGTDTLLLKTRINSLNLGRKVTFVVFFGILDADRRASGDNDPDGLSSLGFLPSGEKVLSERVTALGNESAETPGTFRLLGNYPNPFNPSTAIRYELATNAYITLKVHDALGREVARLVDGPMPPGSHTASWTTGDIVPSGVYFVRLSTGEQTQTRPVVLLR